MEKINWNQSKESIYSAPTQSLLQKWLRDIHKIEVNILPIFREKCGYDSFKRDGYFFDIILIEPCQFLDWSTLNQCGEDRSDEENEHCFSPSYKTYEEALEKGLLKGLEYVKL